MNMSWNRLFRHLFSTRRKLARAFPVQALEAIERAVNESELAHSGEIRVAIEAALEPHEIWAGKTPRARALQVLPPWGSGTPKRTTAS
jgi:hypothetical protein